MKKFFVPIAAIFFSSYVSAQDFNPVAISILDRMSDIIGDLSSCRYTVTVSKDVDDFDFGSKTINSVHEVYLAGPDKMLINSNGDNGHREYWYNGSKLIYYNFDENNYSELSAPATIIETIDTVSRLYGIDFPAADFIYPTFTDDLMIRSDKIFYAGIASAEGFDCFHVIADGKEWHAQFWINNDATMLPRKMIIHFKEKKELYRYEATFTQWQLNPVLPDAMFDFLPPASARNIMMIPR